MSSTPQNAAGPTSPPPPPPPAAPAKEQAISKMLNASAADATCAIGEKRGGASNSTPPPPPSLPSQLATQSRKPAGGATAPSSALLDQIKAKSRKAEDPNSEETYVDEKSTQPKPADVKGRANLLAFGHNVYGRLGVGTETVSFDAVQVMMLPPVQEGEIFSFKTMCIGAAHNYAVSQLGEVFSWGKCHFGQLGHGKLWQDVFYPRKIEGVSGIEKVYAGESFGIFLTTEGEVYTLGCGHFGALGHGDEKAQSRPKKLEFPSKHKFVAAAGGSFHSLFITEDGKVYAAGKNDLGQCGIVGRKQFTTPTLVEALLPYHIISADCGKDHSILLTNDGSVITMGDNESGQLGIGLSDHNQPAQVRIVEFREKTDLDGKVVQVAAQAAHNLVRCDSGSMFTFCAENGVWQNTLRMTAAVPVRVRVPDGVKATWVACGTNMSAFVAENGDLYTWGDAYYGKSGRTHTAYFPEVVDSVSKYCSVLKPTRVDCGSNSTIILIQ